MRGRYSQFGAVKGRKNSFLLFILSILNSQYKFHLQAFKDPSMHREINSNEEFCSEFPRQIIAGNHFHKVSLCASRKQDVKAAE